MKKTIVAVSLAVLAGGAAHAQNTPAITTTQTMVSMCKNTGSSADQNFCHGFAQGVYETYVVSRHPRQNPEFICFKDPKPSRKQALDGFIAWTAKNPQFADKSAADTMLRYLAGAYPCKS